MGTEQGYYNLEWNPLPLQRPKGEERRGASSRAARAILQTDPVAKRKGADRDL